jgi:hypothetical protein
VPGKLRLYTDEDISWRLAAALSSRGFDVLSCHEAGNAGFGYPDEWQLTYASRHDRVILSHNTRDYVPLATQWALAGREHAGIIVAPHMGFARLIERTLEHLHFYDADAHYNVLIHLH